MLRTFLAAGLLDTASAARIGIPAVIGPGYDSEDVPDGETRRAAFDYYGYPDPRDLGR